MSFKTVSDIMTKPVISVLQTESVADAFRIMVDHNCRHVPVVNRNREVVGIVSDRDILRVMIGEKPTSELIGDEEYYLQSHPISEAMSTEPETISPDASLVEASEIMLENRIDCLIVTEGTSRQIEGILSSSDFLRAFHKTDEAA